MCCIQLDAPAETSRGRCVRSKASGSTSNLNSAVASGLDEGFEHRQVVGIGRIAENDVAEDDAACEHRDGADSEDVIAERPRPEPLRARPHGSPSGVLVCDGCDDLDERHAVDIQRPAGEERRALLLQTYGSALEQDGRRRHGDERDDERGQVDVAVPPGEIGREVESDRGDQRVQQWVAPRQPPHQTAEATRYAALLR